MQNEVSFKETQGFRQWWLWLLLIIVNAGEVWFLIKKYVYKNPFIDTAYHSYAGAEIGFLITLLVTILFLVTKLETLIYIDQVKVRLFPYHLKFKTFSAQIIESAYVRKYNAISEYGGWGLRQGLFGKVKAYNVSGNQGIQLDFKDGSKLLIGTRKPDEAGAALQKAGFSKSSVS